MMYEQSNEAFENKKQLLNILIMSLSQMQNQNAKAHIARLDFLHRSPYQNSKVVSGRY